MSSWFESWTWIERRRDTHHTHTYIHPSIRWQQERERDREGERKCARARDGFDIQWRILQWWIWDIWRLIYYCYQCSINELILLAATEREREKKETITRKRNDASGNSVNTMCPPELVHVIGDDRMRPYRGWVTKHHVAIAATHTRNEAKSVERTCKKRKRKKKFI